MTKKSIQSVINEKTLLSRISSPFIVNMHYAFQDREVLYLVMDLMTGGDLRYHIGSRVRFTEVQASKLFKQLRILHSVYHSRAGVPP